MSRQHARRQPFRNTSVKPKMDNFKPRYIQLTVLKTIRCSSPNKVQTIHTTCLNPISIPSQRTVAKLLPTCLVQTSGETLFSMAAFSAGRPNASHPIGWMTLKPRILQTTQCRYLCWNQSKTVVNWFQEKCFGYALQKRIYALTANAHNSWCSSLN